MVSLAGESGQELTGLVPKARGGTLTIKDIRQGYSLNRRACPLKEYRDPIYTQIGPSIRQVVPVTDHTLNQQTPGTQDQTA